MTDRNAAASAGAGLRRARQDGGIGGDVRRRCGPTDVRPDLRGLVRRLELDPRPGFGGLVDHFPSRPRSLSRTHSAREYPKTPWPGDRGRRSDGDRLPAAATDLLGAAPRSSMVVARTSPLRWTATKTGRFFVPRPTLGRLIATTRLPTRVGFIDLHNAGQKDALGIEHPTDAMRQMPCGAVGRAEELRQGVRADALAALRQQEDREEPLGQSRWVSWNAVFTVTVNCLLHWASPHSNRPGRALLPLIRQTLREPQWRQAGCHPKLRAQGILDTSHQY